MSIQIQTPNVTAASDRERLLQMQSYLYRLAGQLQWAFDTIETGSSSRAIQTGSAGPLSQKKKEAEDTFSSIKALIIKSADIVESITATISKRLEGKYVAQSEFGTYKEETRNRIDLNSKVISACFYVDKEITGTEDGLYNGIVQTDAFIRAGELEEINNVPIYGLEVGQINKKDGETVFNKFARFTADRLSFYDRNDTEVAFISDFKLHITNAEVTGSLQLSGKFKIFYNDGLIFQWIGGDG